MTETLRGKGKELSQSLPLLRKQGAIDAGISQYCGAARVRQDSLRAPTLSGFLEAVANTVQRLDPIE
jgi:hypothetical protein